MKRTFLKEQVEFNVAKLNAWLQNNPESHYLYKQIKAECIEYTNALAEMDLQGLTSMEIQIKTAFINTI